jgi:hypothetical protein
LSVAVSSVFPLDLGTLTLPNPTKPLTNDGEFFELLAQALANLEAFQLKQKAAFADSVETLSRDIARLSSPTRTRTDMYAWRAVFSLWIEGQIFESERESDRGEHSVQDAESRLQWFADQVGRRQLARMMKLKESRAALEEFVHLNVTLLDLKRFQVANEEAARKILKVRLPVVFPDSPAVC